MWDVEGEEVGMMVLEDGKQKESGVALKMVDQKDKEEVEAGVVQVESQVESEVYHSLRS